MTKGFLSLVLHAHLPFVYHPENEHRIEEQWLFEAITETYLPLLDGFEKMARDHVDFRITLSLTPSLLSMLASQPLQARYVEYLDNLIDLAEEETHRMKDDHPAYSLAKMYLQNFQMLKERFLYTYQSDLIQGFRKLSDSGYLELITCAATHAFLPYIKTEQAIRAQIENAVQVHRTYLGVLPRGIWLPECGYIEGLDRILKDYGILYFLTDTHGILHSYPEPKNQVFAPVATAEGVAVFARDQEASKQVWSSTEGYPGDCNYREYYRDIGFDLDEAYLKPYQHPSGIRLNTGIKYYRITDHSKHKDWYDPQRAKAKAAEHAADFIMKRQQQVINLCERMERKPLIVAAYDAELFGHWWYEGPLWINELCRMIDKNQQNLAMITPLEYLWQYPKNQQCELSFSSWGRGGYGEVWLGECNEWIYRHLHAMEETMIQKVNQYADPTSAERRTLNQMVRELMLAESSDWAFIMDHQTMVDYAVHRTKQHIRKFNELNKMLNSGRIEDNLLAQYEQRNPIFPDADYRVFYSEEARKAEWVRPLKILMLSWEFPPMIVGGLSMHVYELSCALAKQGIEVHVVTSHVQGSPAYEIHQNVHVHRVRTYQQHDLTFMEWVLQLNLAMVDHSKPLIEKYEFELIHAHDWLVCQAAKVLKHQYRLPLIATIHATEHGRNHGIHTDLQKEIHQLEWELTYEARRVICCSYYMEQEIMNLFQLPTDKLDIIPNGVNAASVQAAQPDASFRERYATPQEKIVFFVGRMVTEKGVHVLLESIPFILEQHHDVKFVLAGKGPNLEDLKHMATTMGIEQKIIFTGFIDEEVKYKLLNIASVAVFPSLYEPFGIVALEAMAAGTPVIVSGVGGLQEVVSHEEDGFTVIPGDASSLAAHVVRMLKNGRMAQTMSERAWNKVIASYNWERIAEQTINTYSKILPAVNRHDIQVHQDNWGNENESSDHGRGQRDPVASVNV